MKCLSYRNVANDVLFQRHFTDVDYLDWFSDESSNSPATAIADLPQADV